MVQQTLMDSDSRIGCAAMYGFHENFFHRDETFGLKQYKKHFNKLPWKLIFNCIKIKRTKCKLKKIANFKRHYQQLLPAKEQCSSILNGLNAGTKTSLGPVCPILSHQNVSGIKSFGTMGAKQSQTV